MADAQVELTVKILGQGDVAVRVPLQATGSDLKAALAGSTATPAAAVRLIFQGRLLDDGRTLASQGVTPGATVHMVPRVGHEDGGPAAASGPAGHALAPACVALLAHAADPPPAGVLDRLAGDTAAVAPLAALATAELAGRVAAVVRDGTLPALEQAAAGLRAAALTPGGGTGVQGAARALVAPCLAAAARLTDLARAAAAADGTPAPAPTALPAHISPLPLPPRADEAATLLIRLANGGCWADAAAPAVAAAPTAHTGPASPTTTAGTQTEGRVPPSRPAAGAAPAGLGGGLGLGRGRGRGGGAARRTPAAGTGPPTAAGAAATGATTAPAVPAARATRPPARPSAAVEEIPRLAARPAAARGRPPTAPPDFGAMMAEMMGGAGGAGDPLGGLLGGLLGGPNGGGGGGFADMLGSLAASPAVQQMAEQMAGGARPGGAPTGAGPAPDFGALLQSVMPMVGGILGGGGAGGRQPARPVRRGDLAALRELPEADAARWRRTIEADRAAVDAAAGVPLSDVYAASAAGGRGEDGSKDEAAAA